MITFESLSRRAINKVSDLGHALQPYYFGFVYGHEYLSDDHVSLIKRVLDAQDSSKIIIEEYEHRFSKLIGMGQGISYAAGRMAFYSLLKALNIGVGDEVILPGFTCSVMPNAVWRVGATPVFADIDIDTFGSDAGEIEKRITSRTKLIVAQHSFGIPCNVPDIVTIGKKYGIFVMEDSAIALDSAIDGIKVGNWADAAIFSTDHSKPLNTLIGGFLYTKDKALYKKIKYYSDKLPDLNNVHQQRLFKQFLFERKNYMPKRYPRSIIINFAKSLAKKLKLRQKQFVFLEADYTKQSSSGSNYPYPAKLPPFLAQLGLFELDRWKSEKKKRKVLLNGYLKIASQSRLAEYLPKAYTDPKLEIVPLRFVFEHPEAEMLMGKMDRYIDVGWTWFQSPVICCPDGPESLGYVSGSCKTGEMAGRNIINWPCVLPENWDAKILEIFAKVANDM
jgi:dTDP-4-amino-4,6-dideoxygalactose transaminase